ncbi:antibiotic biosynthesis monooxygenase family protein [Thermocrinis sp.]|uniref:antibiotic biosynthesis monooxygenase family protein n=1 Tax=Thermocrinis sp. TaxID=2024383 RepID=UPI003C070C96
MFGPNRIVDIPEDAIMNINYVVLKEGVSLDEVAEKVAYLCEHVKTYHSDTGFYGGFVVLNTGGVSLEGSTVGQVTEHPLKEREVLIITFWRSLEDHEESHRSERFKQLFTELTELAESTFEVVYKVLWQGKAYDPEMAKKAKEAKETYAENK